MSDSSDTKVCPHCAETIKATANVCPFCRRPQGKTNFKKRLETTVFMLPLPVAMFGGLIWLQVIFGPGRSFEPYRDKVVVTEAKINFSHVSQGNYVSTIGFLRNDSPYPWKNIQMEVQYFDGKGNLVDTKTETFMNHRLPPGAIHAFRLRTQADKPEIAYVTQKILVRSAIYAKAFR